MAKAIVDVQFYSRRQNTNQGDDQYRVWLARGDADQIAHHVPHLKACLQANATWSERVAVSWNNGRVPFSLKFGAYANQAGEMSFTASRKTLLFSWAASRHTRGQEAVPVHGSCTIDDGVIKSLVLGLTL